MAPAKQLGQEEAGGGAVGTVGKGRQPDYKTQRFRGGQEYAFMRRSESHEEHTPPCERHSNPRHNSA